MTIDLACLVINALWGLALVGVEIVGKTRTAGPQWNMGNREREPDVPDWVGRAGRALANHKENFPAFATAVIVVHLVGQADVLSAAGSVVYVVARFAHGLVYLAGITGLRTAVFGIGGLGMFAVYLSLVV